MPMSKKALIQHLNLEKHPLEGGYFRRTYESALSVETDKGTRLALSAIYYLLTDENPVGVLHKNASDILHFFHTGSPVEYTIVSPEGNITKTVLGPDLSAGHEFQLLVKGGHWKASELMNGELALISETVCPGFDYHDNEVATEESLKGLPANSDEQEKAIEQLERLLKRSKQS